MNQEQITFVNPAVIRLPYINDEVKRFLTYRDKTIEYQIHRLKTQYRYGGDWVQEKIDDLKSKINAYAVWETPEGEVHSYSGLKDLISTRFGWKIDYGNLKLPETKLLPWNKPPKFEMWQHQKDAFDKCIQNSHCAIELPTGSGKTAVITSIIKHFGLKTVVMVPSASIANQIYDEFIERFGIKYVGMYGDGKKNYKKMITVCVAQALTKLDPGSEISQHLNKSDVFVADECHTIPADTFASVCMNNLKDIPYRYFFSATQIRNDGSGIILNGITGPVVHRKSFEDLVSEKILAKPIWKMFNVTSDSPSISSDPKKETRKHLYYNQKVIDMAANIANRSVTACNRQTVILIEEFEQFAKLYAKIKVPFVFASGGVQITNDPESKNTRGYELSKILAGIPENIYKMDPKDAIAQFNEGKVPLIIGTSAISTGIDLKPTRCLIYLQGGTSPIKVKQGVGRGTRIVPGKEDCWFIDFNVRNSPVCSRHAMKRKEIYEELYGSVEFIG